MLSARLLPLVVLMVAAGLQRMDPILEEAGGLQHGTQWVLRRITMPLIYPEIAAAGLLVFNLALLNYTVPSLLRVPTYPVEVFAEFGGLFNRTGAVALGIPLLVLGGLSVLFAVHVMVVASPKVSSSSASR